MADQLNMNQLSINDSKHANAGPGGPPPNGFPARGAYIPPHARQASRSMPMNDGMDGSAWGPTGFVPHVQNHYDRRY